MLDLLIVIFILLLGLSPALLQLAQRRGLLPPSRRFQRRLRQRLQRDRASPGSWSSSRFLSLPGAEPEERYVEGVGFVIGDLSCEFNGRSPLIRCAINPLGPCEGCSSYEPKKELTPEKDNSSL